MVRWTWYQMIPLHQAIAATKKGSMPSRFKGDDGSFGVPSYKLREAEIECLNNAPGLLEQYRATVQTTVSRINVDGRCGCLDIELQLTALATGVKEMD